MKKRTLIIMFAAIAIIVAATFLMTPDDPVPTLIHQLVANVEAKGIEARFWQQLDGV